MNKNLKKDVLYLSKNFSIMKSLINILENIVSDNCNISETDIANLCTQIQILSIKCSKNIENMEIKLMI